MAMRAASLTSPGPASPGPPAPPNPDPEAGLACPLSPGVRDVPRRDRRGGDGSIDEWPFITMIVLYGLGIAHQAPVGFVTYDIG